MNEPLLTIHCFLYHSVLQGPLVRRPISANPGLNLNPGFFFFCSKTSRKNSPTIFRAKNHQIVDNKNETEIAFKLSCLSSNLAQTLG